MDIFLDKFQNTLERDIRLKYVEGHIKYESKSVYESGKEFNKQILHIVYYSVSNGLFRPVRDISITILEGSDDVLVERLYGDPLNESFSKTNFRRVYDFISQIILNDTAIKYEKELMVL